MQNVAVKKMQSY